MTVITIKTNDVVQNFKKIANIIIGGERVLISRPRNENLVIMTEKEANELTKAKENLNYIKKLESSIAEADNGQVVMYTSNQMRELEDN